MAAYALNLLDISSYLDFLAKEFNRGCALDKLSAEGMLRLLSDEKNGTILTPKVVL